MLLITQIFLRPFLWQFRKNGFETLHKRIETLVDLA